MRIPLHTRRQPFLTSSNTVGTRSPTGATLNATSGGSCGFLVQTADPGGAEQADASLGRDVTGAGEGQDAPPLPGADPGDHLSRRSKAEDADSVAGARRYEGTLADQAGAKKGNESDGIAVVQQADGLG
jgi:hypothetical protein